MTAYGLLGRSLSHSFSPVIHRALGNQDYSLFEVEPEDLGSFLANPQLQGINVTIPYKEAVIAHCQSISDRARAIGAVNTMVRQKDGAWYGTNTDYEGFKILLDYLALPLQNLPVALLGNGATAKTATAVLQDQGARITRFARRQDIPLADLDHYPEVRLVINTTPVGMSPSCPDRIVSLDGLPQLQGVVDVVYNPRKTGLILDAEDKEIPAIDGLPMLVGQAIAAAGYFQNEDLWSRFPSLLADLRLANDNIVLIGMPGSGKTTLGRALSKKTGRPFVDCDDLFHDRYGNPGDYIRQHGEEAFRVKEGDIIREIGKDHGLIIATGGGAVTRPENRDPLWQNGVCYFLDCPLDRLATKGRPLSQGGPEALRALYQARSASYQAFAHASIPYTTLDHRVDTIWEDFYARAHAERT